MKKIIFILLVLVSNGAYSQASKLVTGVSGLFPYVTAKEIRHKRNISANDNAYIAFNSANGYVGGMVHAENVSSLQFAVNNQPIPSLIINPTKIVASNYTKLGFNAPAIQTILLTGTTAAGTGSDANSQIFHGLDASKILEVKLQVNLATAGTVGEEYTYTSGYQTSVEITYAYINVLNSVSNSINIRNKPFTLFVTYEQ